MYKLKVLPEASQIQQCCCVYLSEAETFRRIGAAVRVELCIVLCVAWCCALFWSVWKCVDCVLSVVEHCRELYCARVGWPIAGNCCLVLHPALYTLFVNHRSMLVCNE